ncbi:hypothetical protein SPRG_09844 [Saprolegnia parasitica CBS 223.65]|uniref:Uncharacterized protein n=1 Tax=Saprolegnia parasitica (strain CBS 223.65) TaxID=695850 RepID=A0A067CCB1_SAPPC|nr:hypothetical protein SPRG_09844 [Saprolegnia parasitica CBS 223.65]KDO24462.1 hypothetical protein SPRG_09844 [Saprolegnia parasitica CBS 223.65]|eukprot:XP_012204883.1 hypothetical protein SPRG_09844 [Saprolegnia parasitica CBS 223.65]
MAARVDHRDTGRASTQSGQQDGGHGLTKAGLAKAPSSTAHALYACCSRSRATRISRPPSPRAPRINQAWSLGSRCIALFFWQRGRPRHRKGLISRPSYSSLTALTTTSPRSSRRDRTRCPPRRASSVTSELEKIRMDILLSNLHRQPGPRAQL